MADRRAPTPSAWSDPRLYVSLLGILLTAGIYLLNAINNKLQAIDAKVQITSEAVNRMDTANASRFATTAADIEALKNARRESDARVQSLADALRDYTTNAAKEFGKLNAAYDQRKGK